MVVLNGREKYVFMRRRFEDVIGKSFDRYLFISNGISQITIAVSEK